MVGIGEEEDLKKPKLQFIAAGVVCVLTCLLTSGTLHAQPIEAQKDGVMGQSLNDETNYQEPGVGDFSNSMADSVVSLFPVTDTRETKTTYSESFLSGSFLTEGMYTNATYYHKAAYEGYQLFQGIDVSWWQAKNKKTTLLDWEKIHQAGIDFAYVRAASRDSASGSIYEDTAADSHITAARANNIEVGLYIFSQALTEKEAREEASFVLELMDKYHWDITCPIVIDRENGSYHRLVGGQLSKTKETAICQAFADTITKAGYQARVYASHAWIKSYINTDKLENCSIWIARYNNTTTSNSKSGTAYADVAYDYDFWQYSSSAKVDGYSGSLDANFWYKDTNIKTTGLKASAESAAGPVKLSWSKAAGDVNGYRVYRYDQEQDKYVYLKTVKNKSYTDEEVVSGKTYQYKVRCYWRIGGKNYYGKYSMVISVTTPPAKTKALKASTKAASVTLKWNKVARASGYKVYRYNSKTKKYEKIATIKGNTKFTYKDQKQKKGTTCKYKVRAYKTCEGSYYYGAYSDILTIKVK